MALEGTGMRGIGVRKRRNRGPRHRVRIANRCRACLQPEHFCVRPDAQRSGVGTRLLWNLEERLGKSGIRTIFLDTRKGTPAEAFNKKHGYVTNEADIEMRHELKNSGKG